MKLSNNEKYKILFNKEFENKKNNDYNLLKTLNTIINNINDFKYKIIKISFNNHAASGAVCHINKNNFTISFTNKNKFFDDMLCLEKIKTVLDKEFGDTYKLKAYSTFILMLDKNVNLNTANVSLIESIKTKEYNNENIIFKSILKDYIKIEDSIVNSEDCYFLFCNFESSIVTNLILDYLRKNKAEVVLINNENDLLFLNKNNEYIIVENFKIDKLILENIKQENIELFNKYLEFTINSNRDNFLINTGISKIKINKKSMY